MVTVEGAEVAVEMVEVAVVAVVVSVTEATAVSTVINQTDMVMAEAVAGEIATEFR